MNKKRSPFPNEMIESMHRMGDYKGLFRLTAEDAPERGAADAETLGGAAAVHALLREDLHDDAVVDVLQGPAQINVAADAGLEDDLGPLLPQGSVSGTRMPMSAQMQVRQLSSTEAMTLARSRRGGRCMVTQ